MCWDRSIGFSDAHQENLLVLLHFPVLRGSTKRSDCRIRIGMKKCRLSKRRETSPKSRSGADGQTWVLQSENNGVSSVHIGGGGAPNSPACLRGSFNIKFGARAKLSLRQSDKKQEAWSVALTWRTSEENGRDFNAMVNRYIWIYLPVSRLIKAELENSALLQVSPESNPASPMILATRIPW